MKKLLLSILVMSTCVAYGQEQSSNHHSESIYVSIKPVDESPAVFASQEELDEKKNDKIEKIKTLINENQNDSVELQRLREELWRFENAIVRKNN